MYKYFQSPRVSLDSRTTMEVRVRGRGKERASLHLYQNRKYRKFRIYRMYRICRIYCYIEILPLCKNTCQARRYKESQPKLRPKQNTKNTQNAFLSRLFIVKSVQPQSDDILCICVKFDTNKISLFVSARFRRGGTKRTSLRIRREQNIYTS